MKLDKLKKDYLKKIKQINKFNKHYYDKNAPLVTDSKYDELKRDIIGLEKKYDF